MTITDITGGSLGKKEKYSISFVHYELPKSPNLLLGAHWRTRMANAKKWERIVWKYTWHVKPPQPLAHATLTFIRCSSRPLDPDNLVASFKAVQDALVKCGIIADDTSAVIGRPEYLYEYAPPKKGKIKVKVVECLRNI